MPVRSRRFWAVQGLVLLIAVIHDTVEVTGILPHLGPLYFLPIMLFGLPVIYAALNFGLTGALATAAWVTLITIPNWALWHFGWVRIGVIVQLLSMNGVSLIVGWRVDQERRARRAAESANEHLRVSEARYRHLFQSSPVAILLLDRAGKVLEANATAVSVLPREGGQVRGATLSDLVGQANAKAILDAGQTDIEKKPPIRLESPAGGFLVEPAVSAIHLSSGDVTQLVLRDVTRDRKEQADLRAFAASIINAGEDERTRISRELHDGVLQSVVLLSRQLDAAGENGTKGDDSCNLTAARATVDQVMKDLRYFTADLRPSILDDFGLVAAVRRLLTDLEKRSRISVHLDVSGSPARLPGDMELGLYRIVQEAIKNVEKHAMARNVRVRLAFSSNGVAIKVTDDGRGFTTGTVASDRRQTDGHMGLLGMRERAELIGASFAYQSTPGDGTTVSVDL